MKLAREDSTVEKALQELETKMEELGISIVGSFQVEFEGARWLVVDTTDNHETGRLPRLLEEERLARGKGDK
jgi:hypothetical protein